VTEAEVGEWSVKVGDTVKADDMLVELETDKAAQEVPAPVAGTVVKIAAETGATSSRVLLLCQIDPSGAGAAAAAPAAASAPAPAADRAKRRHLHAAGTVCSAKMMAEKASA
jgi:2-oxoglutarate dehydrogenase E2 component (dihydrolipoamide succinyltransferase)